MVEREAMRLAALLDAGRAQSRATGSSVTWEAFVNDKNENSMRWQGLRHKEPLPTAWLDAQTQVLDAKRIVLGPDPVIAAQAIQLSIGKEVRLVVSDGVSAFKVELP
jgi:general secretion pathway protein H